MDSSDPSHPGTEECLQVEGDDGGKKRQCLIIKYYKTENKIESHVWKHELISTNITDPVLQEAAFVHPPLLYFTKTGKSNLAFKEVVQ